MSSLNCPHCEGRVAANPVGRWYAKFRCPHCNKPLQFDRRTNLLGAIASGFFVAAGIALIMGKPPLGTFLAAAGAGIWVVLVALSYFLRGIDKG